MDRLTLKANQPVTLIQQIAATSYTVQPKDNHAVLGFTANAPVVVTLPPNLPPGFEVELLQMGTGQITAQGANMVSPQGAFTTPVQYAALSCLVVSNPTGTAATWRVSSGGAGAGGASGSAATVTSYAAIRGTTFGPTANLITLSHPLLGGTFAPGSTGQRDDGGTCIHDASGKPWSRLVESRVNAQWFYSRPSGFLGDGSAAAITATDVINNPQWVGLPDGSGMYPPGTYWDYVCLQEWIYACAAARSSPPAVFQGAIASAILTVSAWISGPHSLVVGQQIAGNNIAAGTIVCYDYGDGVHYGVGIPQGTGSLGTDPGTGGQPCTATPSGCQFHCYITNPNGALLVVNQVYSGALQIGDLIAAPPGGVAPFGVILPGCYILAASTGPGAVGNWIVGVCAQDVPSEQMNVVGGAFWNKQGGQYSLNRAGWCPNGYMDTNQQLACVGVGLDLVFEHRLSSVIRWHGNMGAQQIASSLWNTAGQAVLLNAISYSSVDNLSISDASTGCTDWLVSVDYNPNQKPFVTGLAPQANSFRDWFIGGIGPSSYGGVALAKAGGAAQTDTQVFINLFVASTLHGVWNGGPNAIANLFIGGNFTACPGRSIYNGGAGCFSTVNTLFEANPYNFYAYPQVNQITMDGADIYSTEVGTENSYSVGTRSESIVAAIDINSATELHAYTMAQNAGFGSYPVAGNANAQHQNLGYSLLAGGNNFALVMAVDDSGPDWTLGQLDAATQTVITFSTPFTGAISGGVLTVDAMGANGGQLNIGDVIGGAGVPGGVTVSGFAYGTGGQAGSYTLAGAAGVVVADGAALTAQPNWPANAWAGWAIAMRYGSNGYTQWNGIASSTTNTVTLVAKAASWPTYATAFKIQSQTGTAPINWIGVPLANFGRTSSTLRGSPGYGWSVKQGSNWIAGNTLPPVGAYAVVCGAQRFRVQKPQGDIGALIGKIGAVSLGGNFNGSILGTTLTVTTTPTQPLRVGQAISAAPGVSTRVSGQTSGPAGGAGGYTVDAPQVYPQSAQFGGSITGNVLTVTNGNQGAAPHPGDYLIGQNGTVPAGTQLVALLSGTAGQTGSTWQLNDAPNSGYDWMFTGPNTGAVLMSSTNAFSLVHPYDGKPVASGTTASDLTGYWGQPIWDGGPGGAGGGVAWIPIDFDAMLGVKQFQGGQIPLGRASRMGPMDSEDQPSTLLTPTSVFSRDSQPVAHRRLLPTGPGPSIAPTAQNLNANPFTVSVGNSYSGIGGTKSLYFYVTVSATLNLPQLPANLELDLDIVFEQWTATPYTITWGVSATGGNAPIRAPTPTLTLGSQNQITSVRMKWLGSKTGTAGVWLVTAIQGPM
jgi:hypothetical protein